MFAKNRSRPISKTDHHFISSARLIAALTLMSRILGLVRDAVCVRTFGSSVWDCFVIPFQLPNLFRRLFGEGALSAALIPIYTQLLHGDEAAAKRLARAVLTLLLLLLTLLGLLTLAAVFAYGRLRPDNPETQLSVRLAAIMLPYLVLICLVGVIGGLLNVHRHFTAPAAAPIILNLCMITGAAWLARYFGPDPMRQIYAVAIAVLVAGFLQLLLQLPPLLRAGISLRPLFDFSSPQLRRIVVLMIPMIVGLSAMQLNAMLDTVITRTLSATDTTGPTFILLGRTIHYPETDGAATALYCAQRLYQFPLGVFGIALATAVFPLLSRAVTENDNQRFGATLGQGFRLVIFIGIPATVGMILVRTPLIAAIFEEGRFTAQDTTRSATVLLFYSLGIAAYCLQHLVTRAYYAHQDSRTPVRIACRMLLLNLALNLILIWPLGAGGIALSTALCAALQVAILLRILIRRYQLHLAADLKNALIKSILAAAAMTATALAAHRAVAQQSDLIQVAVIVITAAATYAVASLLLRNPDMHALLHRHQNREP